jgi:cellulose synthase/poly-beta-1,6-N-acetylglucosamine synthase-like glycosyltransferase
MGPGDELVMVDDGSTDDSLQISAALEDSRIVRVSSGGRGIAAALGRGLEACRGPWIARMDADDVSLRGRFAAQRAMLEADPRLGAVATQIELFGDPGPGIRHYVMWQNGLISETDHAHAIFVESPVCHPSTMIRRAALDAVGGFQTGAVAEDYDLWLRLIAAGWSIAKVPRMLFRWRIHAGNATWKVSLESLRRLRARHLAPRLDRRFAIWGAGPAGRRLARELAANGREASFFIDIDPKKIGRRARGAPILDIDAGLARLRSDKAFLVVAVAARGARDLVRQHLRGANFVENTDFVCAT